MLPTNSRGINKLRRRGSSGGNKSCCYEKMMKTLLLQNQQIIIQQQNMMFMVIKQFQQNHHIPQHHPQPHEEHPIQQHHYFNHHQAGTATTAGLATQQQLQQVANTPQENPGSYLTPAQSEQDPISDNKQEEEDFTALIGGDDLLGNNLLYNPTTDIGSVTPYKNLQQQQTPSCYSSGCESLTTPRVEQLRQPSTANISQNVVKNLADSFKSPTKPKINVQILSGSETMSMKNNKAKIIQRMNISEFLRQVHHDDGQKGSI